MLQQIKHKYKAISTSVDDIRFDSKLEASYYQHLKLLQRSDIIHHFHRQVAFDLPGGVKYICDFLVFYLQPDSYCEYVDVKGMKPLPISQMKIKQVKEIYGVEVRLVYKGDF